MQNLNKKRKQKTDMDEDIEEEDYNFYYDKINKEGKEDEIINVDFLFSEIRDTYFFGIKGFLEGLLNFDEFNSSELADIVLEEKDFLGTVIKCELEEETGNQLPDLYALTTLIPFDFFPNSQSLKQILGFIKKNVNMSEMKDENRNIVNSLLNIYNTNSNTNTKFGLFINERASNLPYELIPNLLQLLLEDIRNYKEANDNYPKYDFSHIIYITKFVKEVEDKKQKKTGVDSNHLYYKYDDDYFIKAADYSCSFKVPFVEKNLDNIENKNEPVFKCIAIIKFEKFIEVISKLK